ncbi:GNAT family N-acetyltransferase [Streptomyces sp. JJ36]|uniref:GNAT family N-acetyltransferase n=1 Tax=Streptomyces sp. JJ36 TaxID=2736645 RepID=UPI001F34E74F|nr:GNAT family N-acetyltransferase [Streptomyces sp. JJ36]MCF6522445.1 GNAT family N-acetyltransferase [Streptomyces sp. JJ36]
MADISAQKKTRTHHWRRELVELAALFLAVAVADTAAKSVLNVPDGPVLLVVSAVALLATAAFHVWWARRHPHPPPGDPGGPVPVVPRDACVLWRLRTTVREEPGSLAALCTALAGRGVDIRALQTLPIAPGPDDAAAPVESTVDELLLRAPEELTADELTALVAGAGGRSVWLERADAHDLVDPPTRALSLATRTALDSAELPLALRQLLGRCTIRTLPAARRGQPDGAGRAAPEGTFGPHQLRLPDPSGGTLIVERGRPEFTPAEFARARALVELDARLGQRVPRSRDALTLPEGHDLTVRRADDRDREAALEMHGRCSRETLGRRYHGPVADADRYLGHLLSPRFGRTLAVETASRRLVALGHLLWDGDETEVALLVEDAWQRRGIGRELLHRLVGMAADAGCTDVYAVTQSSNTSMVATMRSLGMPLDYQVEEGTVVITARLAPESVPAAPPRDAADAGR